MKKNKIVIGAKYGMLTVLSPLETWKGRAAVRVECECGVKKRVILSNLRSGTTKSCGCLKRSNSSKGGEKVKGKTFAEWGRITGIRGSTIQLRMRRGWTFDEATKTPVTLRRTSRTNLKKLGTDMTWEDVKKKAVVPLKVVRTRLVRKWTLEDAMNVPMHKSRSLWNKRKGKGKGKEKEKKSAKRERMWGQYFYILGEAGDVLKELRDLSPDKKKIKWLHKFHKKKFSKMAWKTYQKVKK